MVTVNDILKEKGNAFYSVAPDTITIDVLRLMAEKNIGAVLVTDKDKIVGIFSERDYARKIVLQGKSSTDTHVSEFMSTTIYTVDEHKFITDCMQIMTDKHIRHLPVVDNNEIKGVVSIGDIVSRIIRDQKSTIQQLEKYIIGG
jgi:CBS domain-containing protein